MEILSEVARPAKDVLVALLDVIESMSDWDPSWPDDLVLVGNVTHSAFLAEAEEMIDRLRKRGFEVVALPRVGPGPDRPEAHETEASDV